ncbi:MAG: hypothetical protein J5552_07735 [Prevotella sp.]|nr:hypothetical protein [Prevotella sp.]
MGTPIEAEKNLVRDFLKSRYHFSKNRYQIFERRKVALVIFAVLGYYTGKYHLNDEILFLWLMAAMPIAMLSVIWAINELPAWLGKRKSKSRWY